TARDGSLARRLAADVADAPVRRVLAGINWTFVEGPHGCGLAQTPSREGHGCRPLEAAGSYTGRGLRELAGLIASDNRFEVAIGWAAINAHFNRRSLQGPTDNGLALLARDGDAGMPGRSVVVGRFPDLERYLPGALVIEREPRAGEHGEADAEHLLPGARRVGITASALFDGSADRLIDLARGARIALIGPSTPLAPALHEAGVAVLAGLVIEDADGAFGVVAEAGAVRALRRHGRFVALIRDM
ncbi:MAG: hypothetical protein FJ271_32460, partial [Planctomycetes bacterium]|nr:hypothetical protein [Planctomycetota bacterium]